MSWVAVGVGVAGAVTSYASSKAGSKSAKEDARIKAEAEKEMLRMKRQWQLEDRKYNQDAVGAWAKYLDPALVGPDVGQGSTADNATPPSTNKSDKAVTDPNDPMFAPKPLEKASNAIPMIQWQRPTTTPTATQTPPPPASLWFPRQYPDYDPNNPIGR